MAQSPIAYRLSQIENNQSTMLRLLDNLCNEAAYKEDDPVDNEMVVITCERNGVHMTLNECIESIEGDIRTVFSDVNRLGIIIGDIQEKLGMEVTA